MRSSWLLLLVPLAACEGGFKDLGGTDTGDRSGDGDGGADSGGDSGERETDADDEATIRSAIDGELDAADAVAAVAASRGFPVKTADGYLFACDCGSGTWYLAGDHNGWEPAEMARSGDLSWIEVAIDDPDGSLYKFTDGGELYFADPRGRRYGYDDFGEYSLVRASAAHLERWYDVSGEGLVARNVQVWVPQDGEFTHALYAHDGQNLFDADAFWGGWRLDESVPDDMLVVGIDNTSDRMEEYTQTTDDLDGDIYGGEGDAYAALVEDTVRPMMERAYGEADVVGTMGSSLGGLIAFYIADQYPDRYDMAISLSGTMGWGSIGADNDTMIDLYRDAGHRGVALYLDSGGYGTCFDSDGDGIEDDDPDSADNFCENRQLADVLEAAGYTYEVDLWHWWEPEAEHNELAWADRVWRPLDIFAAL